MIIELITKNNFDKKKEQDGLSIRKFGFAYVNECADKEQFLNTYATADWYELLDEAVWNDEFGRLSIRKLAMHDG